jgi:phosphoglycerate kinase
VGILEPDGRFGADDRIARLSLLAGIRTLADLPLEGRRVFLRADLDVPLSGDDVADDTRIRAALPTMRALLDGGAKLIVGAHLVPDRRGRAPSLEPVGAALSGLSGHEVHLPEDCIGDAAKKVVQDLRPGQICLLENLRLHGEEEEADDPAFAERLAELADLYVNDALRASAVKHASVHALARAMRENAAGIALESELRALDRVIERPERPCVALLGGSSLDVALVTSILARADVLCVGGAVANTFLAARGVELRASRVEKEKLAQARTLLERAAARGVEIWLPEDVVVASSATAATGTAVSVNEIPESASALDIGPKTATRFAAALASAKTILWTGAMGAAEQPAFAGATAQLAEALSRAPAFKLVLGDHAATALRATTATAGDALHISTGGRASLDLLEGKKLPGIEALRDPQADRNG